MKTCIFQLYSQMISWREHAIGSKRYTARHPSRSAIIGLICAALGIRRNETEKLNQIFNCIQVATCVYSKGVIIRDYHTARYPEYKKFPFYRCDYDLNQIDSVDKKDINCDVSEREYVCDAYSRAAICLKNDFLTLEEILDALNHPVFGLYLGSKDCPLGLPLNPQIIDAANLKDAFGQASFDFPCPLSEDAPEWKKQNWRKHVNKILFGPKKYYYWEQGMEAGIDCLNYQNRQDDPINRITWQYDRRREYMAVE